MVKLVIVGLAALMFGVLIGMSGSAEEEPTAIVTPSFAQPTPEVVEVEVEVPGPTETIEVQVMPSACAEALDYADIAIGEDAQILLDILNAYVDYPEENLAEFGRRVETIIAEMEMTDNYDTYTALSAECRSAAP